MDISASECVQALRLAGFRLVEQAAGATILRRVGRVVVVPNAPVLTPQVLAGVLCAADMSELGFHTLLSDAPTLNELKTLAGGDE